MPHGTADADRASRRRLPRRVLAGREPGRLVGHGRDRTDLEGRFGRADQDHPGACLRGELGGLLARRPAARDDLRRRLGQALGSRHLEDASRHQGPPRDRRDRPIPPGRPADLLVRARRRRREDLGYRDRQAPGLVPRRRPAAREHGDSPRTARSWRSSASPRSRRSGTSAAASPSPGSIRTATWCWASPSRTTGRGSPRDAAMAPCGSGKSPRAACSASTWGGTAPSIRWRSRPTIGPWSRRATTRPLYLWDVASRRLKGAHLGHLDRVWGVSCSPDGRTIVSASREGTVKLWPSEPPEAFTRLAMQEPPRGLAFTPDSRSLIAAGAGGTDRELGFRGPAGPARPRRIGEAGTTGGDRPRSARDARGRAEGKTMPIEIHEIASGERLGTIHPGDGDDLRHGVRRRLATAGRGRPAARRSPCGKSRGSRAGWRPVPGDFLSAVFGPRGELVCPSSRGQELTISDPEDGRLQTPVPTHGHPPLAVDVLA